MGAGREPLAPGRLRTLAHDGAEGSWRIDMLAPGPALRGLVWRLHAYAEDHKQPVRRREPPLGLATLVFNLGQALGVEHPPGARATFPAGAGFYAGLSAEHAITTTTGAQAGAQAMLTPLGARHLLGRPLGEVGSALADPADLFGAAARETIARLQDAPSHHDRLAVLERAMERLLAVGGAPPRDLAWAMQRLTAAQGRLALGPLCEQLGCSRRVLAARFRHEFGITPKLLARVLRFRCAYERMRQGSVDGLAGIALDCGYADQAHMTREFRAFAGSPPAELRRRCLPDGGGILD